ncbi:MAG: ABC transporter ATP-binding protein [Saprospiraceae bacterium]|nr:ABC transporter ATP-binding protein [Saprospiraceae bacterium]
MQIIQTHSLYKHFGDTVAAHDISIHVNQGEIYGFLGLNGAGKTTLIRMLLGMIRPDSGTIQLFGQELHRRFDKWNEVGYLVETPYSYPQLTVLENLRVYYQLRQLKNQGLIDLVLEQLKLDKYRNIQAKALSLGNQQRLGLAKALLHRPPLLILDEPTNGLDPEGIVEVRNLLLDLAQSGSTILLSSHILSEISKVAHRIGIVHGGTLIQEMTAQELSGQLMRKLLVQTTDNAHALQLLHAAGYSAHENQDAEIEISNPDATRYPERVAALLMDSGAALRKLYVFSEDLEMYFLRTIRNTAQ